MKHSNVNRVLLQKVSLNTSGNFKCEVTSKKLHGFGTKLKQGRLEVVGKWKTFFVHLYFTPEEGKNIPPPTLKRVFWPVQ